MLLTLLKTPLKKVVIFFLSSPKKKFVFHPCPKRAPARSSDISRNVEIYSGKIKQLQGKLL